MSVSKKNQLCVKEVKIYAIVWCCCEKFRNLVNDLKRMNQTFSNIFSPKLRLALKNVMETDRITISVSLLDF